MTTTISRVTYQGESIELTADWAQASCPVHGDAHGRQVADFRHSARAAMESALSEMIEMGGDDPADYTSEIDSALSEMTSRTEAIEAIMAKLEKHGERFAGNNTEDEAQNWEDHNFDAETTDEWCEIGCWDAATAAEFRDAGLTPAEVLAAVESLKDWQIEHDLDATDTYTDGDPMYSCCNGDTTQQEIINEALELRA